MSGEPSTRSHGVSVWYIVNGSGPFLNFPEANFNDVGKEPGWSCVP